MRKWSMAGVMEQRSDLCRLDFLVRKINPFCFQDLQSLPHQVQGPKGMVKSRMDSTRIDQFRKSQLAYVAHALQVGMLDQIKDCRAFDRDKPVDGIVYDFVFVQDERGRIEYR